MVPLHSDQGLRFLVVGGTECAFYGNGKIICIDGLGVAPALLERIAHAVPGGKRVRLLLKELLVERCRLFELSSPLIAEGQFINGRLVQGVLLQGFVQVADGFLPGAHVFVFQGNVNADFPLGFLVREDQGAFETVNGQLVLRHLAVHRAEGNEHFLIQGFDFQQLLEQGHGLYALTRSDANLGMLQFEGEVGGVQLARVSRDCVGFADGFLLEVMLNQSFQFIHVEEGLFAVLDHRLELLNESLQCWLASVRASFFIHQIKATTGRDSGLHFEHSFFHIRGHFFHDSCPAMVFLDHAHHIHLWHPRNHWRGSRRRPNASRCRQICHGVCALDP